MAQTLPAKSSEWGPWVLHDGLGCPLKIGTIVEVVCEDRFGFTMRKIGQVQGHEHSSWDWQYYPQLKKILRYRVKKPKGLTILEERVQEVREPDSPNTPEMPPVVEKQTDQVERT